MSEMVCVSESVYGDALTRSKQYTVLATDDKKCQVRIKGDNGRTRWYPTYCFDRSDVVVPTLVAFHLDDLIRPNEDLPIEVTVELSNGEQRWCIFATPSALANSGEWMEEGIKLSFHYRNRHLIIANELSDDFIGHMLHYIDRQGHLVECTLPLEPIDE